MEYLQLFHSIVTNGLACGLTHPLEWAINEHRTMVQINYYQQDAEHYIRFLYEIYYLYFMQVPTKSQDILDWANEVYKHNPICQDYFEFLREEIDEFIHKETLRRADLRGLI